MTTTYNEQDLIEALATEADDVMDVDQLRARVEQHRARVGQGSVAPGGATPIRAIPIRQLARRRVLIPAAVAATVIALATPAAVRAIRDDRPNAANGSVSTLPPLAGPAFTLTTSVRPPKGMSVVNETVAPGQQRIMVDRETGYDYGGTTVSTYDAGAFKATTFLATATRTTAAGHAAYFGKYPALGGRYVYLLAWPANATQWISIENPPLNADEPTSSPAALASARTFATHVTTQADIDVTTPLRVRYLPAGVQRTQIAAAYPTRDQTWYSDIVLTDPASPTRQLTISAEPARTGPDSVTVTANTTVAGHPAQYLPRSARNRLPELRVQIGSSVVLVDGSYTRTELGAIAAGITLVAHPADPNSWHNSMK